MSYRPDALLCNKYLSVISTFVAWSNSLTVVHVSITFIIIHTEIILMTLALTETHLFPSIDDDEIHLDGYDLFRSDRNRHGGGVVIFCRSELEPKMISKLSIQNIEMLWMGTSIQNNKIIFGVCSLFPNLYIPKSRLALFLKSLKLYPLVTSQTKYLPGSKLSKPLKIL